MSTKIKVIVDNIANSPLKSEHGYSVYIEHDSKKILFDTAQDKAFSHNINELNVSLESLDYLVLSHGHYDHGGNIKMVLEKNPTVTFVAHQYCTTPRYSIHKDRPIKSTALTHENSSAIIKHHHSKIIWSAKPTEICSGVWVTGEIPRNSSFEDTGGPFFLDREGKREDLLPDDMALFIEGESEVTVICGCCHSGLVNTLEHIKRVVNKPIKTVIGGLHLLYANDNRLDNTINYLNSSEVTTLYPSHCTGEAVMPILRERLEAEVIFGRVGLEIEV